VYVLWSRPIPIGELRPILSALAVLYPSLDTTPMLNPSAGCIRPPGSRHRSGGHQQLTTPLPVALQALEEPCGAGVWAALLDRLTPQLSALGAPAVVATEGPVNDAEAAAGGPLSARVARIAATGVYDTERYPSPSEARQAVITAAAAAGWTLAQVGAEIQRGHWPGLAGFYVRYGPRARHQALVRDWRKAQAHLERGKNARNSTTREKSHTGGTPGSYSEQSPLPSVSAARVGDPAEYQWVRCWWNGIGACERTGRWSGRAGASKRLVLHALASMAQVRGSRVVDVGRRCLALRCGLDDSTVSEVLRALREEDDPVLELLEPSNGERGDTYQLRIPDGALEAAAWRRGQPGPIEAIHPVFRVLGAPAALVHAVLSGEALSRRAIVRDAALPARTVDEALRTLAEHGLAERARDGGWHRGPVDPDCLADTLGVTEIVADLIEEYRVERAAWRALLEARANLGSSPALDPASPPLWPATLTEPPSSGADEDRYDQLNISIAAETNEAFAAIDLLQRELGATVLARSG
jgi:DNA-binding transcriptional ArsR family regulator